MTDKYDAGKPAGDELAELEKEYHAGRFGPRHARMLLEYARNLGHEIAAIEARLRAAETCIHIFNRREVLTEDEIGAMLIWQKAREG